MNEEGNKGEQQAEEEISSQEIQTVLEATSQDAPNLIPVVDKETAIGKEFVYKGVVIEGIDQQESSGLSKDDVTEMLDKLPEGYFRYVPLDRIIFEPYKMFAIEREGKVMHIPEAQLRPTDTITRQARGVTNWNSRIEDGAAIPTDGRMTVQIFSHADLEHSSGEQGDGNTKFNTLAHEIGHTTWGMMTESPRFAKYLKKRGILLPREECPIKFGPVIDAWRQLGESTLPRFQDYKPSFTHENNRDEEGKARIDLSDLAAEEDFAVAHDYYLNGGLEERDKERNGILELIYEVIDTPVKR